MAFQAECGRKGYAICGEPRSGSNFLCQLLASTGRLGEPRDWFNAPGFREKGRADYPADREAQFRLVLSEGATANGVYGLKMFSERFDGLAGFDWAGRLPALHYIHLERRDLLGQALSDVRAIQTGCWRTTAPAARPPVYDQRAIARRLAALARGQARWRIWFARNGIAPLPLVYEEVVENPQAAADTVAALLGLAEPVPAIPRGSRSSSSATR